MGEVPQIFVVAGEPSADQHAALLGNALRGSQEVEIAGVGQSRMRGAGFDLLFDSSGWSGIGVIDSLRKVPKLLVRMHQLSAHLTADPPDLLVLIDFGAFNVRLARRIRERINCPILYYFPPRSWSRDADYSGMADLVDRVATPFPWSAQRLREAGIDAEWVGHPVIDRIHPLEPEERIALRTKVGVEDDRLVIGLLPGSRNTEIRCNGPQMLGAAATIVQEREDTRFLLSKAPGVPQELLRDQLAPEGLAEKTTVVEGLAEIVQAADLVIATSGTATLETAAAACPMIIVYRGTWMMSLERRLRKFVVPFVGMPNIIADEEVVPELIDQDAVAPKIAETALGLIGDQAKRARMRDRLLDVRAKLGEPGVSERVADLALEMMNT